MSLSASYVPFLLIFISIQFISYPTIPPDERTGAPGEFLCSTCHTVNQGSGYLYLCTTEPCTPGAGCSCDPNVPLCDFPTTIDPNTTYSIKVLLENCFPNIEKAGFELVVLDGNESNSASIGTFSNLGSNVTTSTPSGGLNTNRTYLKHSGAKNYSTNVVTYTADWTSPNEITGPIYFYVSGVIGNGADGASGDLVLSESYVTGPLPVEFSDFSVQIINSKAVEITWETATETNSSYFEILRSINAKDYEVLKVIPAAGYSTEKRTYSFIDEDPMLNQTIFYRLKQVDTDGKFFYSSIESLQMLDFEANEVNISPNPLTKGESLIIEFLSKTDYPTAKVHIYDRTGRDFMNTTGLIFSGLQEGFNKIIVDTKQMPEGVYYLNLEDKGEVLAREVFVVTN